MRDFHPLQMGVEGDVAGGEGLVLAGEVGDFRDAEGGEIVDEAFAPGREMQTCVHGVASEYVNLQNFPDEIVL